MVPKLHKKGRSFRGAAAYLLHDKGRAKSSERVAWTETRNLATDDPHVAWKIMAATAMDQDRLKQRAGIKNTGRKSADHVLHLTLSWHPDEKAGLTREEMLRAAHGALRALKAEDRQVLFVSHDDEPQPHLHVLLNRVSPEDGRMLSSSKEKLALSRWAEAYEKERGVIRCEERVLNNAARDRGEFTRGEPDRPRHLFELEAANQNRPDFSALQAEERKKDAEVARRARETRERQEAAWSGLFERYRDSRQEVRQQAEYAGEAARQAIRDGLRERWALLHSHHQTGLEQFAERESRLLGRVQNTLSAIDFRALLHKDTRRGALSEAYSAIASSGARLEALQRAQQKETERLEAEQRKLERDATARVNAERDRALAAQRAMFLAERSSLSFTTDMEIAARRGAWPQRHEERRKAYEKEGPREHGTSRPTPPPPSASIPPADSERERRINLIRAKMSDRHREAPDGRER